VASPTARCPVCLVETQDVAVHNEKYHRVLATRVPSDRDLADRIHSADLHGRTAEESREAVAKVLAEAAGKPRERDRKLALQTPQHLPGITNAIARARAEGAAEANKAWNLEAGTLYAGSEFHDDPKRVFDAVRKTQKSLMESLCGGKRREQEAAQRIAELEADNKYLRKALSELRDDVSAGIGEDGREELKSGIHYGYVLQADAALAQKGGA
jgi:hypothetical protein